MRKVSSDRGRDAGVRPPRAALAAPLVAVLALLLAANVATNRAFPALYLPICLGVAAALLVTARLAGLSWADLGLDPATARTGLRWALVAAAAVLAGYLVLLALPATRHVFGDERAAGLTAGEVLWLTLVRVPLGTVVLEEVAFRGVLWAILARRLGPARATGVSSVLFGLWHVLPSLGLTRTNAAATDVFGRSGSGQLVAVLAAVVGTAVAGVLLCELRRRSASLLAPAGLHFATNGIGYLLAWSVGR
jgi:membrane protease YdiL (CAAX protease family)